MIYFMLFNYVIWLLFCQELLVKKLTMDDVEKEICDKFWWNVKIFDQNECTELHYTLEL